MSAAHIFFLFLSLSVSAKPIETSYLTLTVPDDWTCETIEPSWVCRSTLASQQNSGLLVITAKAANPEESIKKLQTELSRLRSVKGPKGLINSKLEWVREIQLGGVPWLEAQQLNSEIFGYFSYYLATVANGKTVLVNFNYETDKAPTFFPLITKIRNSIVLKSKADASEEFIEPLPTSPEPPPAVTTSAAKGVGAPESPKLLKMPLFWVGVAAVVCLILMAALW